MARGLGNFLESSRLNTMIGWPVIIFLVALLGENLLDLEIVWTGFTGIMIACILLPTLHQGDFRIQIPWPFLVLASLPITARALDIAIVRGPIFTYLSFAALAMIIVVEIHLFTDTKMTHWFGILLVSTTTIAIAGIWAVSRYYAEDILGTTLLPAHDTLMLDFVAATGVGIGAGILFDVYFTQIGGG